MPKLIFQKTSRDQQGVSFAICSPSAFFIHEHQKGLAFFLAKQFEHKSILGPYLKTCLMETGDQFLALAIQTR